MSLQGSLDTFALPDVLVLLASTGKSGELDVAGSRQGTASRRHLRGRLWFDAGKIVDSDVPRTQEAVDAVLELLRLGDGTFSFQAGTAPNPGPALDVEPVLTEAQARLAEWREIERVVPSLSAWLELCPEPPAAHLSLTGEQWRMTVAVGGGCTVESVLGHLGLHELPGCRAVKEMVEAALVSIQAEAPARPFDRAVMLEAQAEEPYGADAPPEDAAVVDLPGDEPEVWEEPVAEAPAAPAEPADDGSLAAQLSGLLAGHPGESPEADDSSGVPDWRAELGDIPDLDALVTIPPRPRRRTATDTDAVAPEPEEPAARGAAPTSEGMAADADGSELEEGAGDEGDEPLNRGLLLKFLSSVRN